MTERYTAELSVRGPWAYTSSWGVRAGGDRGNAIKVWDVSGNTPRLVDSVIVTGAQTTGDVQVSDDGQLLVVATESATDPGSIVIYSLANPARPALLARHSTANTASGVHTAQLARVNGRLLAFLAIDQRPSRLVIVDLTTPAVPREILVRTIGNPANGGEFLHDVFVRDGIMFTAGWNSGLAIWDIGGAARGGTPENPVQLGNILTVGGAVHNAWWFHDPSTGVKRYVFVGEEHVARIGESAGDVHVVDVSDFSAPREVAFFHVEGAGTHNFSLDEPNGVLYAAFYNAGVRALDVRGDLSSCVASARAADGRCDLGKMGRALASGPRVSEPVYVWGVEYTGGVLYASDMFNGLWKMTGVR